jgi:hypothetical protein
MREHEARMALPARERVARAVMLGQNGPGEPDAVELEIARRNAVGLELLSHYPAAQEMSEQEETRQRDFQETMRETSALLAAQGIPHIYIKFRKLYRYYDSNVDVIVARAHWRAAIEALQGRGYCGHVMFKEPDKIMFSRSQAAVSVHLHPGVTWNGVPYFGQDDLWRHSSPAAEGAWLELSAEYDFLVNLAHNVFENYEISLGDTLYFQRFLQNDHLDGGRLERIAAGNGWRLGFLRIQAMVESLLEAWADAGQTGAVPTGLLRYPYRIGVPTLWTAFRERVASNLAGNRVRFALREVYAYPLFWALQRRHDLPFFSRPGTI